MPEDDPMDTDDEDNEEDDDEEEEKYPPWLDRIVNGEYYNGVTVLADEEDDDRSQPGYIRCKEILVPDAADAADAAGGLDPTAVRRWRLKKFTTVLIVAAPTDPPYIGLIDKIWRDAKAKPKPSGSRHYETSDFKLECYWFYRPGELPPNCWQRVQRRELRGAQYQLPGERKEREERHSQRQVLFSSHHTCHDYPDENGLLSLEGFLQTAKVHWLDLDSEPLERFAIHKGCLTRCREPGFVVQGFLWCNSKLRPQLHKDDKRAYRLTGDWGDKATMKIVARMRSHYEKEMHKMQAHNQRVQERFAHLYQQKAKGEISEIPSDDGDDLDKQQVSGDALDDVGRPASPVLPGMASPAAEPPAGHSPLLGSQHYMRADAHVLHRPNDPFGDESGDD